MESSFATSDGSICTAPAAEAGATAPTAAGGSSVSVTVLVAGDDAAAGDAVDAATSGWGADAPETAAGAPAALPMFRDESVTVVLLGSFGGAEVRCRCGQALPAVETLDARDHGLERF